MSDNVNVIAVPNPFRLASKVNYSVPAAGKTVAEMLDGQELAEHVRLSVNGVEVGRERFETTLLRPGDNVLIMPMVAGKDKGIISAVMMIAIVMASGPMALKMGFLADTTGMFLAQVGIVLGGGMLIAAMNAQSYKAPGMGDLDAMKQSYGWNPQTVQRQGLVVPKHYGKSRVYGNIVACHTEVVADEDAQTLEMVVSLGMGPIESISDVRLNDQPVANYSDVSTENKLGTIEQTAISLFSDTKPEYRPNIKVVNGTPVTYTTPDDDFDDIEVDLYFARGIYWANDSGGLSEHSIGIKVEVSVADADSWTTIAEESVTNDNTGQLWKTYLASDSMTITNGNKYDIKVTKTTEDKGARYGDDLYLSGIREVLNDGFLYPRTVLVGISALATGQLSGSLKFSCVIEGSIVNTYNGTAWTLQYSNNPAWVVFDLLTKPVISGDGGGTSYAVERYDGLNPTRVDIAKFYELADFCDDMVDDGKGGTEKRITYNGGFESETNVWDAIFEVCEIARCVPVWNGTQLTLAIDKARSVVGAYTVGNIVKDQFSWAEMEKANRASEIIANYRDAGQDYKKLPFTIYNQSAGGAGNKVTLNLEAVTKQSEVWRYGKYRLAQNQLLGRKFTWMADVDALPYTVGDRIKLQHDVMNFGEIGSGADEYNGGGVISAVNLAGGDDIITLDRDISSALDGGSTYELMVRLADDTVETLTVKSWSGAAITLDGSFSGSPAPDDIWAIGLEDQVADDVQIINFERTGKMRHRVVAVNYDAAVYANDTGPPVLPAPNVTTPGGDAGSILRGPTLAELNAWYPSSLLGIPTMDVPVMHNITWNANTPGGGSVSWSATDATNPLLFTLKGITYEITAANTANTYIYWDSDHTTSFQSSNSINDAIGAGKWLMCYNASGTAYPAWGQKILHGGLIQADTIITSQIQITGKVGDAVASQDSSLLPNWRLDIEDSNGRPAGIYPVENIAGFSQLDWLDSGKAEIKILSTPDSYVAYGFPAIPIDDKQKYTIVIRHKSSATSTDGLYLRFNEYDSALPLGKTHIGRASGGSDTQERNSLFPLVDNGAMPGTSWVVNEYTYIPTAGTKYATFGMYNFDPDTAEVEYHVDYVLMYVVPKTADEIPDGSTYGQIPKAWKDSTDPTKMDLGKGFAASITTAQIGVLAVHTAQINDLAVNTLQIANNAVTLMVAAFTAGQSGYSDIGWHEAQTITMDLTGAPVMLIISVQWQAVGDGGMNIRIQRDNTTTIYATNMFTLAQYGNPFCVAIVDDDPGIGEHTYDLDLQTTDVDLGDPVLLFKNRSLVGQEVKK